MHTSIVSIKNELSKFGLNPTQWLVQKISLQKEGTFVFFKSFESQGLELKGLLKRTKSEAYSLGSLEISSL